VPTIKSVVAGLAMAVAGCAEMDAGTPAPDPAALTQGVEVLSSRLDDGADVDQAEFDQTLAPFEKTTFSGWPEPQLLQLVSSFQRLRSSLVTRYRIIDPVCADDSWVRYSLCEPGYPCVAEVQLAELHCLWFVAH
jgi:hypothetical protein